MGMMWPRASGVLSTVFRRSLGHFVIQITGSGDTGPIPHDKPVPCLSQAVEVSYGTR